MAKDLSKEPGTPRDASHGATHQAGAFDIRNFIAALIGAYGVILTGMGLFATSDADMDKTGGYAVNLWAGLGMVVFAAAFVLWARLRPVVVPEQDD
ncbi:hypothetical protein GCM10028777_06420 [Angustibacter speluncae]|jgi:hypothetical protein